jgi:cytochrome c-type biogenesis protein CcmF
VITALLAAWVAGHFSFGALLGFLMSTWIVASIATDLWERLHSPGASWASLPARARLLPRAMVGMFVAHLGVAAFAFGVSMVRSSEVESDVRMDVGDSTTLAGYTFTFRGVHDATGPNYDASIGELEVTRSGQPVVTLHPEKRVYRVQRNPMTEAAIDPGPTRDLYVSLGEAVDGRAWIVRIYVKPFVDWIWGGCLLMALGGALAASDRRYRVRQRETQAATAAVGATS